MGDKGVGGTRRRGDEDRRSEVRGRMSDLRSPISHLRRLTSVLVLKKKEKNNEHNRRSEEV